MDASQELMTNFFTQLKERIRHADYYGQLYHLLGNDGGIESCLENCCTLAVKALVNEAKTECDRFDDEAFVIKGLNEKLERLGLDCVYP